MSRVEAIAQQQKMGEADEGALMIAEMMKETRASTLQLFDLVPDEMDLHQSPGEGFRPLIWHLAHIGVFEAYWLLQHLGGESAPDERYERIFDPIKTPREESKDLPTRREMEGYLSRVRDGALRSLERATPDDADPLLHNNYLFHLVLEHERQHQETLAYLLHLLDPAKKRRPAHVPTERERSPSTSAPKIGEASSSSSIPSSSAELSASAEVSGAAAESMVTVPTGIFAMGAPWESFAYDNEYPAHTIDLPAFKLDRLLTTNEEYANFIEAGGYERREFWSDEGWTKRTEENWTCPYYWRKVDSRWHVRSMFEENLMEPAHPVTGVSWYEAEAYARFMQKRLPTEAEWEKAASWDAAGNRKRRFAWGDELPTPARCNYGNQLWHTTAAGAYPAGASYYGCMDMTGNVWEWTGDPFEGYAGFEPFPYREYSETWFDGDHRVLKGGSWSTSASVLRTSFRNFFRRHFRIAFAGIRCASDD